MGDEEKWWKAVRDEKKMKRSDRSDEKWKENHKVKNERSL